MKVRIFNNNRKQWWASDYFGYTEEKADAGVYDIDHLYKNYGLQLMTFDTKRENYLVIAEDNNDSRELQNSSSR